jgi:phage terminase small subunit
MDKKTDAKPESAYLALSPKRQRFVDEYIVDCNGTQAAIRAGYSAKSAQEQAAQLLSILIVKQAIEEKLAVIRKENELTVDYVIDRAKKIIERCMQAEPVYDNEGNPTGEYRFDASGANGSLKILARYLGMEKTTHVIESTGFGIVLNTGKKPKASNDNN